MCLSSVRSGRVEGGSSGRGCRAGAVVGGNSTIVVVVATFQNVPRQQGFALQTTTIEDLPVFVEWNHFEEFLFETLLSTCDTFTSFLADILQLLFGHDRAGNVEIRAHRIHNGFGG